MSNRDVGFVLDESTGLLSDAASATYDLANADYVCGFPKSDSLAVRTAGPPNAFPGSRQEADLLGLDDVLTNRGAIMDTQCVSDGGVRRHRPGLIEERSAKRHYLLVAANSVRLMGRAAELSGHALIGIGRPTEKSRSLLLFAITFSSQCQGR